MKRSATESGGDRRPPDPRALALSIYRAVIEHDLTFDALGFPRHLAPFLALLKRYPEMRVVIDHCMKPDIANHSPERFAHWAQGMARLAGETGHFCKFSALVTEIIHSDPFRQRRGL